MPSWSLGRNRAAASERSPNRKNSVRAVITGASTLALVGGRDSIDSEIEPHRQPFFYSAWLLALAGLSGIAVAADAFNIFVFMEISSLAFTLPRLRPILE